MKILTVPFAGGNAHSYRALQAHVATIGHIEGLELPGRGMRVAEPLCRSLEHLADDLFERQVRPAAAGDYLLFGHSMGASLVYLLLLRIRRAGLPLPRLAVLSGKSAPSIAETRTRHRLDGPAFREMLARMGGCPPEILAEKELMDYFEPILRSDFEAVETWRPTPHEPLPMAALVLHGRGDEMPREHLLAWQQEFIEPIDFHEFEGDHFFIQRHWQAIGQLIARQLGRAQ